MIDEIKQISFKIDDVAKRVNKSKKRVEWIFEVNGEEHTVTVSWSKLSGRVRLSVDGSDDEIEVKKPPFLFKSWSSEEKKLELVVLGSGHTPAKSKLLEGFVKYDLIVNGQQLAKCPNKDGSPLPEKKGPGPESIFDIIYPAGYHKKEGKAIAPFEIKKKKDLDSRAKQEFKKSKNIDAQVAFLKTKSMHPGMVE